MINVGSSFICCRDYGSVSQDSEFSAGTCLWFHPCKRELAASLAIASAQLSLFSFLDREVASVLTLFLKVDNEFVWSRW